jgi:DNA-binding MarR family transcriptional regulator/GNAT superfamily N-acetyltransferase
MSATSTSEIRAFNRWYTDFIGLLNKHLLDSNYSLAEARLLYEISAAGTIRASQLMTILHIDKSYLSRLLRGLEKAKLISRRQFAEDARAVQLSLSEKGRRVFATLDGASDLQITSLLQPLSENQRGRLVEHLHGVRQLIGTARPEASPTAPAPPALTIRTILKPGDLGYVGWLHGRIYDQESGYGIGFESYVLKGLGELGHQYDPKKDRIWICENSERIVGFLAGVNRGDSLQLRYFILLPEYRGKGLARQLMDSFLDFLRDRGYHHAFLWTTNEQHAAIALYTRYGFRLTEEKTSEAFGKSLTERKYELHLANS